MLRTLVNRINQITEMSGVVFFMIMLVVLLIQVFCRYIFNNALASPEEVARFTFLWATYAGIAVTVREKSHLRIEILPVFLPKTYDKFFKVLCEIVNVLFFAYFVWISCDMVREIHDIGVEGVAVPIAMWIVWLALPVYGAICVLNAAVNLIDLFNGNDEKSEVQL